MSAEIYLYCSTDNKPLKTLLLFIKPAILPSGVVCFFLSSLSVLPVYGSAQFTSGKLLLAALMLLFEGLCVKHCAKEVKQMAASVGWFLRGQFCWAPMPSRGWNLVQKVGKTAKIGEGHAVVYFGATYCAPTPKHCIKYFTHIYGYHSPSEKMFLFPSSHPTSFGNHQLILCMFKPVSVSFSSSVLFWGLADKLREHLNMQFCKSTNRLGLRYEGWWQSLVRTPRGGIPGKGRRAKGDWQWNWSSASCSHTPNAKENFKYISPRRKFAFFLFLEVVNLIMSFKC